MIRIIFSSYDTFVYNIQFEKMFDISISLAWNEMHSNFNFSFIYFLSIQFHFILFLTVSSTINLYNELKSISFFEFKKKKTNKKIICWLNIISYHPLSIFGLNLFTQRIYYRFVNSHVRSSWMTILSNRISQFNSFRPKFNNKIIY